MNRITVVDLGRMAYRPALELQRALVRARLEGGLVDDLLLLVEHDPVVTLGRGTRSSSLPLAPAQLERRGFDVVEVERGGDVTVHGPGQLVGYPIIDLERFKPDLHWYLRQLEGSLIGALNRLGVSARQNPGLTGVWVADRKIARLRFLRDRWAKRVVAESNGRARMLTPIGPGESGAIGVIAIDGMKIDELRGWLMNKHKIVTVALLGDEFNGLRVTPNVYTTLDEVDRFAEVMISAIKTGLTAN